MEKRCHGKDYKVLWKDMHTTCRESFGEAFSDLFQDKWWRPQTEEIDNSEGGFFWSCYTFPPQVTLGCTPWVAFPTQVHPAEFLGSWKGSRFACQPCQMAVSQALGPLWFVCDTAGVSRATQSSGGFCTVECPCYIRALYLIHKQFILPLLSLGESWIVTCDYCNWMAGCNLRAVTCIPMLS